jgi:hypothetical protein
LVVVVLAAVLVVVLASSASAGQQTRILYGMQNSDVYTYTPTETGVMHVQISWTGADGTGAPVFPEAEVDGVVQMDDETEPYADANVTDLFSGENPTFADVDIELIHVDKPLSIGVNPFIGDVPYRLEVWFPWTNDPATDPKVIDTGAIDVGNPAQKWAYGNNGEVYLPEAGPWHSVLQYWPGSLDRPGQVSDVYANWDDFVIDRDTYSHFLVENFEYTGSDYVPPVVSDVTIDGPTGPSDLWYVVCPQIWTSAARPNVWTDWTGDVHPEPGSLPLTGAGSAPLWYTYSWPDSGSEPSVAYMTGVLGNTGASGHAFNSLVNVNSSVSYTFVGTSVNWIFTKGPLGGVAKVTIDGGAPVLVDLYNATAQFKQSQTFGGLADTVHTIVVESNKTKNPASGNFIVYHDAFEATSSPGDTTLLAEGNTDGSTQHTWGAVANAGAHGGSFVQEHNVGAAVAFTFEGESVDYIYTKGPNGGIARVYVDGIDKGTVDMYSATASFQQSATYAGLSPGWHTIFIKNERTKNAASGNFVLYLDAFRVGTTYYEN